MRDGVVIAGCWGLLTLCAGCAHQPPVSPASGQPIPQAHGSYYRVQSGETLWRIAHDFGLDVQALVQGNRLSSATHINTGQLLFIPLPPETDRFLWPARGQRSRTHASGRNGGSLGLYIDAPEGSFVRASRTGRVAVAAKQIASLGSTAILDHADGYVSIYSGLGQLLVSPGADVRQGVPVGRLGRQPLYFEIRYRTTPHDPVKLLPQLP